MEVTTLALIATATVAATVALPAIANADTGSFVSPSRDIACNMGFACEHQSLRVPGEQTLDYGQTQSASTITCDSELTGVTCTDSSTGITSACRATHTSSADDAVSRFAYLP